jgi:hypothetical protein
MKKLTLLSITATLAFAAVPAFADQPLAPNPNSNSQGSAVGQASSAFIHNGTVVREQAQSGNRSDLVQTLLGH